MTMTPPIQLGINVDPNTDLINDSYERAAIADANDIDLITIQDHPYQRRFLETWTLLTMIAAKTERVHVGTNVSNLPLRPPMMLAKMAATLDVLTGGRVELGLGAGAFWQAIEAWGEPARSPKAAYDSFEDALHILKGFWSHAGRSFSYMGSAYSVKGALPGPAPAHDIPIWVGASGPKMLNLTGRMADGILISNSYFPPESWTDFNHRIDDGAAEAGRSPDAIRRGYNVMGIIELGGGSRPAELGSAIYGTPREWADELLRLHREHRVDTFLFWPLGSNPIEQIKVFAEQVAPMVR
jgi:alkanesulfonate monooxygenase SsuD/methylene tetrahydromethanopterin reductase-like flavin-dependent oxidoreductase (luciferase family)